MGVIAGMGGGDVSVTYFFDRVGSTSITRLEAVVLRRRVEREQPVPVETPNVMSERQPHEASEGPGWSMPDGWNSSSGTGADAVLYSSLRRLVSVAGVEYRLPASEQTCVLMINEATPSVTVHLIDVPQQLGYEIDRSEAERARADSTGTLRKALAARMSESMRVQHRAWDAALKADPVVRQFLIS
ncbi:MAG: hypothetical protein ABIT20_21590 [Gemmatimonadaceae bacterium]